MKRNAATQAPSLQEVRAWIRAETRARQLEEHDNPNVSLAATERFPIKAHFRNEKDGQNGATAEEARMLRGLIAGKCCGWPQPPSIDEALRAMRTRRPTKREIGIAETVISEATIGELADGEQQGSYCLQDLAWWMHFTATMPPRKVRWLNRCIGVGIEDSRADAKPVEARAADAPPDRTPSVPTSARKRPRAARGSDKLKR